MRSSKVADVIGIVAGIALTAEAVQYFGWEHVQLAFLGIEIPVLPGPTRAVIQISVGVVILGWSAFRLWRTWGDRDSERPESD